MRKIVILYSNTGAGHLRAAEALKKEILSLNPDSSVILYDGLAKLRFGINTKPSSAYALLSTKLQRIYNLIYGLTNNKTGTKVMRLLTRKAVGRNLREILKQEKPDLIISTHELLSKSVIKKPQPNSPFITVVTDLGKPHGTWFDESSDKIITPTRSLVATAKEFKPGLEAKTIHIDYPLDSRFQNIKSSEKINNSVLLLGGGTGSGNLETQIKSLVGKIDQKIIIVCGRNLKLHESLLRRYKDNPQIEIHGFSDNLPELYSVSDIVLTKAGPGAIVEAAALGKPVIITGWVGLQEKENIAFVLENKLGIYEPEAERLADAVKKVYGSYRYYTQEKKLFNKGARTIAEYINLEYLS